MLLNNLQAFRANIHRLFDEMGGTQVSFTIYPCTKLLYPLHPLTHTHTRTYGCFAHRVLEKEPLGY